MIVHRGRVRRAGLATAAELIALQALAAGRGGAATAPSSEAMAQPGSAERAGDWLGAGWAGRSRCRAHCAQASSTGGTDPLTASTVGETFEQALRLEGARAADAAVAIAIGDGARVADAAACAPNRGDHAVGAHGKPIVRMPGGK